MKIVLPLLVIFAVVGITLGTVLFRYEKIAVPSPDNTASTNGAAPPSGVEQMPKHLFVFAFSMAAFLFGLVTAAAFYFASGWWTSARSILFYIALSLTLFFSIGAAIVRTKVVHSGAIECIVLNIVWGMGYGWLLPLVMTAMNLVRRSTAAGTD